MNLASSWQPETEIGASCSAVHGPLTAGRHQRFIVPLGVTEHADGPSSSLIKIGPIKPAVNESHVAQHVPAATALPTIDSS